MELENLKSFISEIENDLPTEEWVSNGVCLWPMLRTYLLKDKSIFYYTKIFTSTLRPPENIAESVDVSMVNFIGRVKASLKYRITKMRRIKRFKELENKIVGSKADVLFHSLAGYNVNFQGKAFNRFVGPLIPIVKENNLKYLFFELNHADTHEYLSAEDSIPLMFMLEHFVTTRAEMLEEDGIQVNLPQHEIFFKRLQERFPKANLSNYTKNEISRRFAYVLIYKEFYCKYLAKLNLKAVFQVCFYSPQGFALNLACKELSIPCIDIQHGLIGNNNFVYSRWNLPESGYDALPDYFFTWGKRDADIINAWAASSHHRAIAFGNVWLQFFKGNKGLFESDSMAVIAKKYRHVANPKFILFASAPISSELDILPAVKELISCSPQNYVWLFRKHQRSVMSSKMIQEYLSKSTGNPNIEVELSSNVVIPLLFSLADIHVTGWSSTTIDATYFGTHTLLITKVGTSHFLKELEEGLVSFVGENPKDMLAFLHNYFASNERADASVVDNVLYKNVLIEFLSSQKTKY